MRFGIFVDAGNLYYTIGKRFPGRKLNYVHYLDTVSRDAENEVIKSIVYGTQHNEEAQGFITCLKKIGYTPNFKTLGDNARRVHWECAFAVDIIKLMDRLDVVVLGSSSPDLIPLVNYLKEKGIEVRVVSCGINRDLKAACNSYIEIDESWLEERKVEESAEKTE